MRHSQEYFTERIGDEDVFFLGIRFCSSRHAGICLSRQRHVRGWNMRSRSGGIVGMWPRLWQQLVRQSEFSECKRITSADTWSLSLISTRRSYAKGTPRNSQLDATVGIVGKAESTLRSLRISPSAPKGLHLGGLVSESRRLVPMS